MINANFRFSLLACAIALGSLIPQTGHATPANKAMLAKHYDRFLAKRLDACTTCHLPAKDTHKIPTSLAELPHNPFGRSLFLIGGQLNAQGKKADIPARLAFIGKQDSDGDGVPNEAELLLGNNPGDPKDRPTAPSLATLAAKQKEFAQFLASYRWQPFDPVKRPAVPKVKNMGWVRNPIDSFVAFEHEARGLKARPAAAKPVLLRRVYLDLIGLSPTPDEMRAFLMDTSPNAYEKVVDRLLNDPRYGERWGRHWLDIWRYSDWAGWSDGGQIRDSKPHIWRWRDWTVEALNKDKGYDRMLQEMLAADELAPGDSDALRATGFLVRNFKLLSREQWLEDTMNHTTRAFMGVTMHCTKCHDHMYDPITQADYYRMRAVFEPHNVRTDRIPGEPNPDKDGLVLAYDADPKAATYYFIRGDERNPDKSRVMSPAVPPALGGALNIRPIAMPRAMTHPDQREFVVQETLAASQKAIQEARKALEAARANPQGDNISAAQAQCAIVEAKDAALRAVLQVERLEVAGREKSDEWKQAATDAVKAQRQANLLETAEKWRLAQQKQRAAQQGVEAAKSKDKAAQDKASAELTEANKALEEAEKAREAAEKESKAALTTAYKPRSTLVYPAESTGRRLAFARWLTEKRNPLTARVAMNQMWMRHFGQGIVPSTDNFGRNGRRPSHPQLLDWLAAEFMSPTFATQRNAPEMPWSMKWMHRLMVTSSAYRMASTPDLTNLAKDPDNIYLWRMNSRRMEAEVVRDNVLYVTGNLDGTMGGPEIDHNQGLTSRRRSLYLRLAAEKEVEFLKIFDGPSVTECYERKQTVMPQQALALANSELALREARRLARELDAKTSADTSRFLHAAFQRVLSRPPTAQEKQLCATFLAEQTRRLAQHAARTIAETKQDVNQPASDPNLRARENLVLALFNHHDFVTIR